MAWASVRWMIRSLLAAIAALAAVACPSLADEPPAVMIVFDGSGSMWGKLAGGNGTKFAVGRDAVRQGLEKLPPATRVGLASFGHRRQGDCSDVELMLKPEKLDVGRITGPLEKLNPKGRGPLVQALREAAKALPEGAEPSTIVLLQDDLDNCQQDACAAAGDIHKSQPRLVIHVIGLGLKKDDFARMECVAKTTGGRLFDVQDAGQAATQIGEAIRLAGAISAPPPPAPAARAAPLAAPAPEPARRLPAQLPDNAPPGLYLAAVLAANGEPLAAPIQWRVLSEAGAPTPVAEPVGAMPVVQLPPGSYTIEARAGLVTARETVAVAANTATLGMVKLNAAALRLSAPLQPGGEPQAKAVLTVREASEGTAAGAGKIVWMGPASRDPLVLPPGTYAVKAEQGLARRERTIVAALGALSEVELALAAGRLTLRAVDREGGEEQRRVLYIISEDDPEAAAGRREVVRSAAVSPQFTLPSGTYYITARQGAAEVRDRVLLAPGEVTARTLVLGIGQLTVSSRVQGSSAQSGDAAAIRILTTDGSGREIARGQGPAARFELGTGRYRVESRIGRQNAVAIRDVDVKAGAELKVTLEHPAGNVRLRLADTVGQGALGDVSWEIVDAQGRPVWQTVQAEAQALLAAGRYKVKVRARDRLLERAFEVRVGESRPLEVTVE